MNKNYSKIINEEIDKYVNKFDLKSSNQIVSILNELFTLNSNRLMDNIGSVEADGKNEVAMENWDLFIDSITNSIQENPYAWKFGFTNIKRKILTNKYFTKKDMIKKENLDSYLRLEIKKYFTALQNYVDAKDFLNKFFNLPSELLYNIVRYIFLLNEDLNNSIIITNKDLKDNINKMMDLRLKIADKISKISNGYVDLLDIKEVKELYDNGVIFEDNYINRGISEFIVKLLNHKSAMKNIIEIHSGSMIHDLKQQSENSSCYISHITALRNESDQEYFSVNGEQVGKRFDNQIEIVEKQKYEGYIIDKESRFKEPNARINNTNKPWESNTDNKDIENSSSKNSSSSSGGGMGTGGSFGGGSFGNSDFGGEFAPEGTEGEVSGAENTETEKDGTPMPKTEEGVPEDFGTIEDNTPFKEEEVPEEIK